MPRLLTTAQVSNEINVKATTLRQWRLKGIGPPYIKIGPRTIRYDRLALEDWLENVSPSPSPEPVKANKFGAPEMPRMNMKRTKFNFDNIDD